MSLMEFAEISTIKTEKFQNEWLDVINSDLIKNNIKIVSIPIAISKSYLGNFYGLLNNDLLVGPDFWYPHLLINGYNSNIDFNGETEIKMIESGVLENMIEIFKKQK